jgi:DNA-binding CsgD family transcriptional regulator
VAAEAHFSELVDVARRRGEDGVVATGLVGMGAAAVLQGDCGRAADHLRDGIALAAAAEVHTETIGRIWLAEVSRLRGDAEGARHQLQGCLAQVRSMGAPYPLALSLLALGRAALDQGDAEGARRHLDEALAVAGEANLGHLEAAALDGLGEAALALDGAPAARGLFERSLAVAERCGDQTGTAYARYHLAETARAQGDVDAAVCLHHDALRQFHAVGVRIGVAASLDALGALAAQRDDVERAARLFGAAHGLRQALGGGNPRRPDHDADVARARERSEPEQFARAWRDGTEMGVEEAVAYASKRRGRGRGSSSGRTALSDMERQVVELVRQGLTNAEVAERLFTSPETVKTLLSRAFAKLGVRSRRRLRAGPHPDA